MKYYFVNFNKEEEHKRGQEIVDKMYVEHKQEILELAKPILSVNHVNKENKKEIVAKFG